MMLPMAAIIATRGNIIRARRYAAGLQVRELAGLVGISPTYLSAIERGRVPGSPAVLVRLAAALHADPADFINDSPAPRAA